MIHRSLVLSLSVFVLACNGGPAPIDRDAPIATSDAPSAGEDAPISGDDAPVAIADAPITVFPAVCQEWPVECPDQRTLDRCEMGAGSSITDCSWLPITLGCASAGCPSDAQNCRTAENSAGFCTHFCTDDEDCPLAGGGLARCTEINPGLYMCIAE